MSESSEAEVSRVEVGRYARLSEARERGLVVLAKSLAHWIEREGDEWVLFVEEMHVDEVRRELAAFEMEQLQAPIIGREMMPLGPVPKTSLFVAAWILMGFFFAQQVLPEVWSDRGVADSVAILNGEWWRTITALTLHADGPHLAANLGTGLLYAFFLIPRLGTGMTWLSILLSGAVGNALNAWNYRAERHLSIGASTACFGALGILVGMEWVARWRHPHTRSLWQLIVPIGAGLALLAFLGVGDEDSREKIDYMAHFWGGVAGFIGGVLAELLRVKERMSRWGQIDAAIATVLLIGAAWLLALRVMAA